jgi:putative ABC transport system ATP-binding protein
VAPETPSEDPPPPPGDAGGRTSPTITSDWGPPLDDSTAQPAPFVAALMDGEVAAEVVDAVKIYGYGETAVYALAGVSVSFGKAHFTAIMGPSGSGKSTLMHCLAGLDRLTQGTVLIGDADLSTLSDKALTQLRRDRVGFIFQQYNLVPTLTAIENITLPLDLAGTRPDADWLDSVIDTLRIRDRLKHKPDELSGGQQQRVAVARALATRPQIIFADEPTGNLDTRAGAEVLHIMQDSVRQLGQTVVMVTHDPVAAGYADRAIFLMDGRVVSEMYDPTAELVLDEMKTLGG